MKIPLVDLKAQYASIKEEIDDAVRGVLHETDFIGGSAVSGFEKDFAESCGTRFAVGVANGTDAIFLALKALKVGPGDEVIVPVNTFIATAEAVSATGAHPVFVDCDPDTHTISPKGIEEAITKHTKAVIPVHLYGLPADMEAIRAIARSHDVTIIEDAAQAHGATYQKKPVGGLGSVACFSFYPAKNLGAYGDAGAITTDDESLANTIRMLGNHGRKDKYEHLVEGYNSRLDTLQAAILRVKLRHLESWTRLRQQHAAAYSRLLAGSTDIALPVTPADRTHAFHLYVVRVRDRDTVRKNLASAGIATGIHYPIPLHLQPAYASHPDSQRTFPVAERDSAEVLSLPLYPELTGEQIHHVVQTLVKSPANKKMRPA